MMSYFIEIKYEYSPVFIYTFFRYMSYLDRWRKIKAARNNQVVIINAILFSIV